MKKALAISATVLVASFALAETRGAWHITIDGTRARLDISRGNSNHWGETIDLAAFSGLTAAAMNGSSETPVKFELVRDAGTIHFTGTFVDGDGVGRLTFEPNRGYAAALHQLGVSGEINDDDDLFRLAMHDISIAFIREMQSLGYRETLDRYVAFRIHGVTPQFARDLRSLGYDSLTSDNLVAFRIHGVSSQFVRDMKELGVRDLGAERLVALRIHGASTDFVRELGTLGYTGLSSEELVRMRIHDVSPQYIRDLKDAGYSGIPVEKLVQMRIRGLSADDVRRMK